MGKGYKEFGMDLRACIKSLQSCLSAIPRTAARTLCMGFSRQESWNGLSCPPPWNLPHSGIKPSFLHLQHCMWSLYCALSHQEAQEYPYLPFIEYLLCTAIDKEGEVQKS